MFGAFICFQIRGFLSRFHVMLPASQAFDKCTACSDTVMSTFKHSTSMSLCAENLVCELADGRIYLDGLRLFEPFCRKTVAYHLSMDIIYTYYFPRL